MAKKILILTALLLLLISCGEKETIADNEADNETEEIVIEAEPLYANANELYELLITSKPVWETENMAGGTLVDLDFDEIPELLVSYGEYAPNNLAIYKFGADGTMEKIRTIENLYAHDDYHTEFNTIIKHGNSWIIPYREFKSGYFEYNLSSFDFTGEEITETILFSSKIFDADYSYEGYYGYQYLDSEFYIGDKEVTVEESVQNEFMSELKRLVDESFTEQELGNRGGVPWECGMIYMTPAQEKWENEKTAFLNMLLENEVAYDLFPALDEYYIWSQIDGSWYYEENIAPEILKLSESYLGDKSYLKTTDLYYDNGGAMCKPVIYLYPEETTDITVTIEFTDGGFTCTYPEYGGGWEVTADPDGKIINRADGREYSYLYWEGESGTEWDISSGFVVKGSETALFLQEKLEYIGLIPREYNEFIVYWLPLMQNNEYNLITFQTKNYEYSAKLNITPEPDSILRVFMAYVPLSGWIDIPEQTIEPFERNGFSVIEWGGTSVG